MSVVRILLTGLAVLVAGRFCDADVDFEREVRPLLKANCFRCHGAKRQESGLRLDVRDRAVAGGNNGPALVPGNALKSELFLRVVSTEPERRMPPEGDRLSKEQVDTLQRWINEGARGLPEFDLKAAWRRHWAFRPITRPSPPFVNQPEFIRNPVDAFVLRRVNESGITPSKTADRTTLIRRLSLDLIGLLPDVDRVAAFVKDERPDAWERLVDEYLASPHYGERWGRHWLDVARYADSTGYEADQPRVIWAYRDWVINAMNADKPFDRFVIEQLAGDLLAGAGRDDLIATGFHCNSIFDGGVRWQAVVDRVNTTSAAFLGLTTECARCHSHKTDPLSHREFYQLYAFFNEASATPFPIGKPGSKVPALTTLSSQTGQDKDTVVTTLVMKSTPQPTHIFRRGDPGQPGIQVMPGVPSFLPKLNSPAERSPNRLDLARWLVQRDHPLTARVTVNRVWQRFFGRGLVESESDFGMQTPRPEHAKLLDWLASEFIHGGWSLKRLQRMILLSATYRQSSVNRPDLREGDPENEFLARQQRLRLPAEIIRDTFLDAGGLLSTRIGGPSVFPRQPEGVLTNRATPATWTMSEGADARRRGLYTWVWRLTPHPHLPLFDAPDGIASCTRRARSNVPVQSLTLLNDPTFVEAAQALSHRIVINTQSGKRRSLDDANRLHNLFRITLARPPQTSEQTLLLRFIKTQRKRFRESPENAVQVAGVAVVDEVECVELATWTVVSRAVLNLDEFYTRE